LNTNDLLLRWSTLSLDQIEDEIRTGKDADSATALLGFETMLEIQSVSFAPPAFASREPVVLLPGTMGSLLASISGVATLVWINPLMFLQGNARYLRLDPSGQRDECREVEIVPVGLEKLTYLKMGLSFNREVQLFEFPYDWRRAVEHNADRLHDSLERWSKPNSRKYTLVAHSMGGLVARAYFARHPRSAEKRIKKLVMLGTPNFGAANAIETLMTGNSIMGTVDKLCKANAMLDIVRGLPGVYNLLPAPRDCFPAGRDYPVDWDLYDSARWHTPGIQQAHLDAARRSFNLLARSDPQVERAVIAGCNMDTLVGLISPIQRIPRRMNAGVNSGDGTVPLWSALLPGASTYYIQEKHVELPNNREVIRAALKLVHDETPDLPASLPDPKPAFAIPSIETPASEETAAGLEAKIRAGTASQDDLKQLYFAY